MSAPLISKKATWIISLSSGILGIMGNVIIWSQRSGSRSFFQKAADVIRMLI